MAQKKVLLIKTGGTVCQERDEHNVLRPTHREYLDLVLGLHDLAEVTVRSFLPIDSTNMTTSYRADIARLLYDQHAAYDGFVLVHGTDSLVDTAAAFNYMLHNFGKPVVLTGSQIPIFDPRTDAINNIYHAVQTATLDLGEIVISFGKQILRGNRSIKISEEGFDAFYSPRVAPLGEVNTKIHLSGHRIGRYRRKPSLFVDFDTGVEVYRQTSGTSSKGFSLLAHDPDVHGIVFSAFGAGNIRADLLPILQQAVSSGKPVAVVTNCLEGTAEMGVYEVGADAIRAGAFPVEDMTLEAAVQKMMYALGKAHQDHLSGNELLTFVQDEMRYTEYARDITPAKRPELVVS